MPGSILIVDDDADVRFTARMALKNHFERVESLASPKEILPFLASTEIDIVLLDMNFAPGITEGREGIFWLRKILKEAPDAQVILTTAYGDIELAVEGMRIGAADFLIKPWKQEKLLSSARNVLKIKEQAQELNRLRKGQQAMHQALDSHYPEILSQSPTMKPVFETIRKVAQTDAQVLILGENGTGKELVARAIHRASHRRDEALVKVDLGAIAESLFESELFGHRKGAFTDAKADRIGHFESATGGTLFLDEIGNLPLSLQAKLLTALQHQEVRPLGAQKSVKLNIRLITATNSPLHQKVHSQEFRQDLLYRINTVEIHLPPLRDRKEDISLLSQVFLDEFGAKYDRSGLSLSKSAQQKLQAYHWPGNIRELQHAIERAVILTDKRMIGPTILSIGDSPIASGLPQKQTVNMETLEREAILQAIKQANGNLTQAARKLGFGRSTLYRKMEKYGL